MRRRFRLVLSGSCAVLAAMACLLYGEHTREEAERARAEALERYGGEVVSLVVATETIEAGGVIDRSNVAERDWVSDLAPADAVTGIDTVLGDEVSVPVSAGVPLTALNFRDAEDAVEVPADRMALSVPVSDDMGIASSMEVGATLAAYEVSDMGVRLLADDLQVLASPQGSGGPLSSGSVTVAVAPADVAQVLAASGEGSLRLALPGEGALELTQEVPVTPTEVTASETGEAEGA
ncbi:SAF domain-containing protein [Thermophilibacter provencensis]|uniref:SAF domain-containing protein n=1 Tax=Thermophilibacter provencensis TaxID=1852386 RepID=A0ABT7V1A4_9ACTN|nr:SAF domain-containing protein [Thermophilibacter provencensis]MDM8270373.1 SAF domain-containing protein [Thermophilibacter provencensis]